MASPTREELRTWLKTIDVDADKVIDIGGISRPVLNQTKSWNVKEYKILDNVAVRREYVADYIYDLNLPIPNLGMDFDVAFCLEVMPFIYDPVEVMKNIAGFLKVGGLLYISFHQVFTHVKGNDFLRFTRMGVEKLMEISGFKILEIKPRLYNQSIRDGEVGHFVKAIKL